MTRIDFYILQTDTQESRWQLACKLSQKALAAGMHTVILVDNEEQARELDAYMWSYSPESFIPHAISGKDESNFPIVISHGSIADDYHDMLINLQCGMPPHFSRFSRLAEVVIQTPDILAATRKNYTFYKSRGYPTHHHPL